MTRVPLLTLGALAGALLLASPAQAAFEYDGVSWGGSGSGSGQLQAPGLIAVSPDGGAVYVADTGNNRVQEFTADGAPLAVSGAGELNGPSAVATSPDGAFVYV